MDEQLYIIFNTYEQYEKANDMVNKFFKFPNSGADKYSLPLQRITDNKYYMLCVENKQLLKLLEQEFGELVCEYFNYNWAISPSMSAE